MALRIEQLDELSELRQSLKSAHAGLQNLQRFIEAKKAMPLIIEVGNQSVYTALIGAGSEDSVDKAYRQFLRALTDIQAKRALDLHTALTDKLASI